MNIKFTDRLSYKQARNTVFLAFSLGMILSLAQVWVDYDSEKRSIDSQVRAIIDITQNPASRIAYNIDSELAQELVSGLLESPIIISAKIVDNTDAVLAEATRHPEISNYRALSDLLFGLSHNYREKLQVFHDPDEELGFLEIEIDTFSIGSSFLRRSTFTLLNGFISVLTLSIFLLVLFYVMLTKPLVDLVHSISSSDPEKDRIDKIPCPVGHEKDEIGVLVNATNEHVDSIRANLRRRLDAETQLQQHLAKLESTVGQRTADLRQTNRQLTESNEQLDNARREAESMADARAVFLANMSHEIRTPINGVLGMISIALEGDLPEQQRKQLETAYSSGNILTQLLNDILDLSKFDSGKMTLEEIEFDLRESVEQVARLLSESAAKKSLYLSLDIEPNIPEKLMGDPVRINQLVSNLLSNAIKFTEQGEVQLYVNIQREDHDFIYINFEVSDTGIGIDQSVLEDILKPFTQADTDTTRKYGGTGLGLALCQKLADAMNGSLSMNSTLGQGSSFKASIPIKRSTNNFAPPILPPETDIKPILCLANQGLLDSLSKYLTYWDIPHLSLRKQTDIGALHSRKKLDQYSIAIIESSESCTLLHALMPQVKIIHAAPYRALLSHNELSLLGIDRQLSLPIQRNELLQILQHQMGAGKTKPQIMSQPTTTMNQHLNILVVEDNQTNQIVAEGMLLLLGHKTVLCNSGKQALQLCKENNFDLIFMDCNMPVIDGYQTTRNLRTSSPVRSIPIIALTANALSEDRQKCLDAGMNDYLSKPFRKEELAKVISKWCPKNTTNNSTTN